MADAAQPLSAWHEYDQFRMTSTIPGRLSYGEVVENLSRLQREHAGRLRWQPLGDSAEGRPIHRVDVGQGTTHVVLWSQMHGDEPTHTVVLLELLQALCRSPASAWAQLILSQCTLTMVPMLNPDGAVRWSRFNAHSIDVNRDARRLATPEGLALHRLISQNRFDFAFNLHNQNRHSTVDGRQLASVSLLVPPLDESDTETLWVRRAKAVAGQFVRAVRPHCTGLLSRYDAGYMPRCFGEWVQSQQVSTVLVEAGGGRNRADAVWLTRVHFCGLLAALYAIAAHHLDDECVHDYLALPRSSAQRSFDLMIRDSRLRQVTGSATVDLGINLDDNAPAAPGTIDDVGDLRDVGALVEYPAQGRFCQPGNLRWLPDLRPSTLATDALDPHQVDAWVRSGTTTVLGCLPLDDDNERLKLKELPVSRSYAVNVGFLGLLPLPRNPAHQRLWVLEARVAGVLGLVSTNLNEALRELAQAIGLPCVDAAMAAPETIWPGRDTWHAIVPGRGRLERGAVADLALYDIPESAPLGPQGLTCAQSVWVGGVPVLLDGRRFTSRPGCLLRR